MGLRSRRAMLYVATGGAALAGCASMDLRPGIVRHETPKQIREKFHGPDVSIRAMVHTTRNSRLIQPTVSLADSAYLVVGDIGDDGTLRIIYPAYPGEPNLVAKSNRFSPPAFRPRVILPYRNFGVASASTAPGHVFVIASAQPLRLEKLAEEGRWSLFDVYYDDHMTDPRNAITDLAAAISTSVGDISIAYYAYGGGSIQPRNPTADPSLRSTRRLPRPPS